MIVTLGTPLQWIFLITITGVTNTVINYPELGDISTNGADYYVKPSLRHRLGNKIVSIIYQVEDVQTVSEIIDEKNIPTFTSMKKSKENVKLNKMALKSYSKRSAAISTNKKVCTLFLQADYSFYKYFGSERESIDVMARHVKKVNEIFGPVDFDMDGEPGDISFVIKRVRVETKQSHMATLNNSVEDSSQPLLEFADRGDYSSFCLAYLFTMRNLGHVLGRALTVGSGGTISGVCQPTVRVPYQNPPFYLNRSHNIGLITLKSRNNILLPMISYMVLAHELGHSFGARHDPTDDVRCHPGEENGYYIMNGGVQSGFKKNHKMFSPCSVESIMPILRMAREKEGCLTGIQSTGAICGNRIIEEGEECDCGWEEDCTESCCFPMKINSMENELPCTLRPKANCSPSQGTCCTNNCTLSSAGVVCRHENQCTDKKICDGKIASCPLPMKQDGPFCGVNSICDHGICGRGMPICTDYGLEPCLCSSPSNKCELCCKHPRDNVCISSFEWNDEPHDVPDWYLPERAPCSNPLFKATCDVDHVCTIQPLSEFILDILRHILFGLIMAFTICAEIITIWFVWLPKVKLSNLKMMTEESYKYVCQLRN